MHALPDRCDWFAFAPDVLREALRTHDPEAADRPESPFTFASGPSDLESYFRQRKVVEALAASSADPWRVEVTMLGILERLLASTYWRLRLAAALERLRKPGADLTGIALDLGYSSHSHFAAAFRRNFGVTPSAARAGTSIGRCG